MKLSSTSRKLAAALGFALLPSAATYGTSQELNFRVLLDDKPIGTHQFVISNSDDRTIVDTRADFSVKFLFIRVYAYLHENREVWREGCLERIQSTTNDNGTRFLVEGQRAQDAFRISTFEDDQALFQPCVMTFAYWNRDFLKQSRLLNSQTGEYLDVSTEALGSRRFELDGEETTATGYRLSSGDGELDISVWYQDVSDQWVALESNVGDGKLLRYLPSNNAD